MITLDFAVKFWLAGFVFSLLIILVNDIKYQKEMKEMRERLEKEGSWEIREI